MEDVIYETIEMEDVLHYDKERFNTNNHWINNEPPLDYKEINKMTHTHNWIDKFGRNYIKMIIDDPSTMVLLKVLAQHGAILGKFSELYRDELDLILERYKHVDCLFRDKHYFVGDEHVSLKYVEHGVGPYNSFEMIIRSMTTTIPQQNCYKMIGFNNESISPYIEIIISYFQSNIKNVIEMNNYTYDFAIIKGMQPYFIEVNSFGKEYAAGSSLFHWLLDEHKLYDSDNEHKIYVRYTK